MKVLFFASLREKLGCSELDIATDSSPATLSDLRDMLRERSPEWDESFSDARLLIAVNQEIATDDQALQASDEVAFFPPVTGG